MKPPYEFACLLAVSLHMPSARTGGRNYPVRPIRVIVTTSPGGISDIFLRALADRCTSGSASRS